MRLTLILLLVCSLACNRIDYGGLETYTVKKGEHTSDFPIVQKGTEIYANVFFTQSCKYEPQPEGFLSIIP